MVTALVTANAAGLLCNWLFCLYNRCFVRRGAARRHVCRVVARGGGRSPRNCNFQLSLRGYDRRRIAPAVHVDVRYQVPGSGTRIVHLLIPHV